MDQDVVDLAELDGADQGELPSESLAAFAVVLLLDELLPLPSPLAEWLQPRQRVAIPGLDVPEEYGGAGLDRRFTQ